MKGTFTRSQRLLSLMLALVLVFGMMPSYAGAADGSSTGTSMVADDSTADSYKDMLGVLSAEGNRYTGRIWTDKSVYEGTGSVNLDGITDIAYADDEFLTVYSTLGSTTSITTEMVINGKMDVVIVLDNSASMGRYTDASTKYTRLEAVTDAANSLIAGILEESTNRLAVVTYSTNATTLLPLNYYNQNDEVLSVTISSKPNADSNGGVQVSSGDGKMTASATILDTTTKAGSTNSGYQQGTNMQSGINEAGTILNGASDTEGRIPVIIVLTDGVADYAVRSGMIGDTSSGSYVMPTSNTLNSGVTLSTLLNAAYWKYMVGQKYGTAATMFTVGVDIGSDSDANVVMDPVNYFVSSNTNTVASIAYGWYTTWATGSTTVTGTTTGSSGGGGGRPGGSSTSYTWTFAQPDAATKAGVIANINYSDEYYNVTSSELSTAFESILTKISTTQSAFQAITDMNGNSPQTYVDFIGDYMQVNEFKGVTLYGKFYSVAQGNVTTVDNGDGTITVTTQYIVGQGTEAITDPLTGEDFYIGDVIDIELIHTYNVDAQGNQTSAGEQELWIHILEEAMPLIQHNIKSENGVETYTIVEEVPLRVYYTVGVSDYIAPAGTILVQRIDEAYLAANTVDGVTYFYSNQYYEVNGEASGLGDTHTSATPHEDNRYYFHQYEYPVFSKVTTADGGTVTFADGEFSVKDDGTYLTTQMTYADVAGLADSDWVYTYITFRVPTGTAATEGNVTTYNSYEEVQHIAFSTWGDLKAAVTFVDADGNYYTHEEAAAYTGDASDLVAVLEIGSWRITRLHNMSVNKAEGANKTETAPVRVAPALVENAEHEGSMVAWLGNNGRLGVTIEPVKTVYKNGDLSINIDGEKVMIGDELTYQIKVTNHEDAAADITITDTIPTGTVYIAGSATKDGKYANGVLTWTLEDVAAGETVTVTFKVTVVSAAVDSINNTADIIVGENSFESNTTVNYPEGKTASAVEDPVGTDGVQVGSIISYTIHYFNDEASAATVTITDTIPAGTSYVDGSASHGGTYENGKITWTISDVPAGTSGTVSFRVHVDASAVSKVENTATIKIGDNDPAYDTNTTINDRAFGDLVLTKTVTGNGSSDKVFTLVLQSGFKSASALTGEFNATVSGGGTTTVKFESGQAKVTIKHGQTVTIHDLPAGITISVYEESAPGYSPSYTVGGETADVIKVIADAIVTFDVTNHYSTTSTKLNLTADKFLSGRTLAAGKYSFVVKEGNAVVATGTNDADGNITFTSITYTAAGKHTYVISELNSGDTGISYDTKTYTVTVKVIDNGEGQLVVSEVKVDGTAKTISTVNAVSTVDTGITFRNAYSPDDLLVRLYGTKILVDGNSNPLTLAAGDFTFEMTDADGNVVASGTNDENGLISFSIIEYNFEDMTGYTYVDGHIYQKTFTYSVFEVKPDVAFDPYMSYSAEKYEITVTVTYDAVDAEWSYTVTHDADSSTDTELTFKNVKYPSSITVPVYATKHTVNGDDLDEVYFSVSIYDKDNKEVAAGSVSANTTVAELIANLSFTGAGTYTYTVKETKAGVVSDNGITYDSTSYALEIVVSHTDGQLIIDSVKVDGQKVDTVIVSFENDYHANGSVTLTGIKILEDKDLEAGDFTFDVFVKNPDGSETVIATGSNDENGDIIFGSIFYSTEDGGNVDFNGQESITLTYYVREQQGTMTGVTYDTDVYTVEVTLTHDDGKINTSYAITEVNGQAVTDVTVIEFNNTYAPVHGDSIKVQIDKELSGRDLRDGEFTFQMYHVATWNGEEYVYLSVPALVTSASNDGNGDAVLIRNYPATAVPGTYLYKIQEVQGNIPGVKYDGTVYYVEVTITDIGAGSLNAEVTGMWMTSVKTENAVTAITFENSYAPTSTTYTPEADKTLIGRDMDDKEFSFEVKDKDGNTVSIGESAAAGDGEASQITFSAIPFTAKGEYVFTITEINSGLGGVKYDENVIYMVVTVTDNQTIGKLEATAKYYSDAEYTEELTSVGFVNTYEPTPIQVKPTATKVLSGKNLADGEFAFLLKEGDVIIAKGTNDKAGRITFWQIDSQGEYVLQDGAKVPLVLEFSKAGEHIYTVSEVKGDDSRYTYSETVYTVKLVITDDGAGNLSYAYHYYRGNDLTAEVGAVTFYNTYNPNPVTVDLNVALDVDKNVNDLANAGYSLEGFEFEVYNWDGKLVTTGVSDADGNVVFADQLSFNVTGDYRFAILEKDTGKAGVAYDGTVWVVHVVVEYDADKGVLYISEMITHVMNDKDDHTHAGKEVDFVNTYDPQDVTTTITIGKNLTGRDLRDGEFTFRLMDGRTVVAEGVNVVSTEGDADGYVTFFVTYDKVGRYHYTVVEVIPEGAVQQADGSYIFNGVTYDARSFDITVTVSVDPQNPGRLIASVEGEGVAFENTYKATSVSVELGAVKVLDGRTLNPREFEFILTDEDGNTYYATNDANGVIKFEELTFREVGKHTYTYTITEAKGNAGGVTYSEMVYTATVEITDNGLGVLEATVTYTYTDSNGDQRPIALPLFFNTYEAKPVSVKLTALKKLLNKTLAAGDYTFVLKGDQIITATNDAAGNLEFLLNFTEAGVYEYVMYEEAGEDNTIEYDGKLYDVVIDVRDDGQGNLYIYSVTVEEDALTVKNGVVATGVTFVNTYKEPDPTEPDPTEPDPTEPDPTEPDPTEPDPTEPDPTEPDPTEPDPTEPDPTEPDPTEPDPTDPQPTDPEPTDPEIPKTGDETNLQLLFFMGVLSFAAMAVLVIDRKRFNI